MLNDNKDGRFCLEELYNFAKFCGKKLKNLKTYEFQSQLQAASTMVLWQSVRTEEGENDFVAWVGRLLYENEEVVYFPSNHEVAFIKIESVKLIYEIFDVKTMNGMDIQAFIDLLHQCGEEAGLMALECEEYDQYVPLIVCQDFAKEFIRGLTKLMKEIGFDFVV